MTFTYRCLKFAFQSYKMLTSNYNEVQISSNQKGKYKIGDYFVVPEYHRRNYRFMKFDNLQIKNITYGFGIFLHFDYNEWQENTPTIEVSKTDRSANWKLRF